MDLSILFFKMSHPPNSENKNNLGNMLHKNTQKYYTKITQKYYTKITQNNYTKISKQVLGLSRVV